MSKRLAESLKNATLLLAGHGSSRPGGDNPVHRLSQAIKAAGTFAAVLEGYLKQPPLLAELIGDIATDELFVVPMLTGHGYITDELIPRVLLKAAAGVRVLIGEPVGRHPAVPGLLAAAVRSVIDQNGLPPENVAVLLAAHGNRENPQNSAQVKALAGLIGKRNEAVRVRAAFIDEAPLISHWRDEPGPENLIVLPFLIGGGRHGAEDVPAMLGLDPRHPALAALGPNVPVTGPLPVAGRSIWCCRAFGHQPEMADIVIDIAAAMAQKITSPAATSN